jgi:septum formation protein
VTRSSTGPTDARHAKTTFSADRGALRRIAANASGRTLWTGITIASIAREYNADVRLLLASGSPRRAELLRAAGFDFDVHPADVDESLHPGETPDSYVRRVAEAKARAVREAAGDRAVLAADTVVVVRDRILGKPLDDGDAAAMLRRLSGRAHKVMTGLTLVRRERLDTRLAVTIVQFAALSDEEIAWYVASGEPFDKAGAYAVQGLASRFVTRIEGSYSNVVGLPVALLYEMLREVPPDFLT